MNRVATPIKSPSARRLSDTPRRNSRPGTPIRSDNPTDGSSISQNVPGPGGNTDEHGVSVMIRIRPLNEREKEATRQADKPTHARRTSTSDYSPLDPAFEVSDGTSVRVGERVFMYDGVMGPETTQQCVFESCAIPNVEACISGYHATFMAYGQSGAGKTHTISGGIKAGDFREKESNGIIPRSLEYLFRKLESQKADRDGFAYSCTASFVEIYNERVMDLFASTNASGNGNNQNSGPPNPKYIQLNYNQHDEVVAAGLSHLPIVSSSQALSLFVNGNAKRHTSSTGMNEHSSRSHSIFTVQVNTQTPQSDGSVSVTKAKLSFVDLAGSECLKNTQAKGQTQMEAANINKSLLALSKLIMDLVTSATQGRAPQKALYRGSALTKYLKDCFGGNNKLCLIANISPAAAHITETLSTLTFAAQARKLPNKPRSTATTSGRADANELVAELMRVLANAGTSIDEIVAGVGTFRMLLDDHLRLRRTVLEQQIALLDSELEIRQLRNDIRDDCGDDELDLALERSKCMHLLAELPECVDGDVFEDINTSANSFQSSDDGAYAADTSPFTCDAGKDKDIQPNSGLVKSGRSSSAASLAVVTTLATSERKRASMGQIGCRDASQNKRRRSDLSGDVRMMSTGMNIGTGVSASMGTGEYVHMRDSESNISVKRDDLDVSGESCELQARTLVFDDDGEEEEGVYRSDNANTDVDAEVDSIRTGMVDDNDSSHGNSGSRGNEERYGNPTIRPHLHTTGTGTRTTTLNREGSSSDSPLLTGTHRPCGHSPSWQGWNDDDKEVDDEEMLLFP